MFSRKQLEGLGLDKDLIDKVLDAHSADIGELKAQMDAMSAQVTQREEQIAQLQKESETRESEHAAQLHQLRVTAAVDAALTNVRAKNLRAARALLSLDGAEFDEDGSVKGLKEQLDGLMQADDSKFLFDAARTKKTSIIKGASPAQTGTEEADKAADLTKMSYEELVGYYETLDGRQ